MSINNGFRADGGDIGTGRLKEIADNSYGDEEKCWLAKRVLALLDELEAAEKRIDILQQDKDKIIDMSTDRVSKLLDRAEEAEKRIAELTEFLAHIKKCLVRNGEYAPLSHEEIDTILGIRAAGIIAKVGE